MSSRCRSLLGSQNRFSFATNLAAKLCVQTLFAIDLESLQRSYSSFCALLSEGLWADTPFLRQVIDLDLLLYTGFDWEHCRFVLMQRFKYTNKLLLNEGKLKSFQVQGRAWIIFCTVTLPVPPSVCKCVDLPSFTVTVRQDRRCGHDSGGYHEIQGSRKGDLGVSEQPDAIEYLSFHCGMQQLTLVQTAQKQRRFLCYPKFQTNLEFLVGTLASWLCRLGRLGPLYLIHITHYCTICEPQCLCKNCVLFTFTCDSRTNISFGAHISCKNYMQKTGNEMWYFWPTTVLRARSVRGLHWNKDFK